MALTPGARVGPYEIVSALGAGGMGEVYRARDTRLRREVALKVLPTDVSTDTVRRARFEQEARAAAALNHPNILGVHDIGSDDGVFYIATELVNGETLAAIIDAGPVPARRLLDIAVQVADGMACAHAAHIVHRDLKPANVMVATDGRVKILDFGLAKQSTPALKGGGDATMTIHHTEAGMIVGTVSYMSPEQARGKPTDHRSDQFSFGLVLYEMATGRKAFDKAESVQTMSAIISEEPPPIEARIPAPLRWSIDRCLAKDPGGRYESTRDLFHELRSLRDHLSEASSEVAQAVTLPGPAPHRRSFWYVPAAFVLGVLATLAAILAGSGQPIPDQSAYRYTPFSFEPAGQHSPVWSPDGKAVAYAARQDPSSAYQIFIRYLDSTTPLQLTHTTDDATPLAWSPDGTRILLTTPKRPFSISSIATVGGEPEPLMSMRESGDELRPDRIAISPDNKAVAAFRPAEDGVYTVWITSPPGSQPKRYAPDPFATKDVYNTPVIRFSPDGRHIMLFVNAGRRGEEAWLLDYPPGAGGSHSIFPGLQSYGGTPRFAWMPDNRHLVMSLMPSANVEPQLWLADTTTGERHALTSGTGGSSGPAVSPDGEKLILSESTGNYDIVSVDLATGAPRKLIATERNELMPSWAAKQPALTYVSDRNGPNEIWLHRPDNPDRPIVTARDFPAGTTQWFMAPAMSPDANRVIYTRVEMGTTTAKLWISGVAGGTPIRLTNDTASEFPGSWSPEGAWYVYGTFRDGKVDLMKVKTTGQAAPTALKKDVQDGNVPSWSPAGDWIAFGEHLFSPDGKTVKPLGEHHSPHYMFSADGQSVYGLRSDNERELLFRLDIATGAETIIRDVGRDFRPDSNLGPSIRFSLAPDGKSFVYGSGRFKSNLWMLEGFASRMGMLARLGFQTRPGTTPSGNPR